MSVSKKGSEKSFVGRMEDKISDKISNLKTDLKSHFQKEDNPESITNIPIESVEERANEPSGYGETQKSSGQIGAEGKTATKEGDSKSKSAPTSPEEIDQMIEKNME
jgi:hypothetical protein